MNKLKTIMTVLVLSFFAQHVNAATQVANDVAKEKHGVVSVTGAATVEDAINNISVKADKQGATAFKVISLGGDNKLFAVAEIYK